MESLVHLLAREQPALERFCALLDEERKALGGSGAERLLDVAAEKQSLAAELGSIEKARDRLLAAGGYPPGRRGVEGWLADHPEAAEATRRWQDVLRLARQARDGNEANGRLINLLLQQNQEALSQLMSGGTDSIYGTDGQQRRLADGKRSLGKA